MNAETMQLLTDLSFYRARSEPAALQSCIARMWRSRWTTMLSLVCQDSLSATLIDDGKAIDPDITFTNLGMRASAQHSDVELKRWGLSGMALLARV